MCWWRTRNCRYLRVIKLKKLTIREWEERGSYLSWNNHKIFYVDTGSSKPNLLLLHGFPTSSYDFHLVIDILSKRFRVIIHDHLGFGLSDKPKNYSYSLEKQASLAQHIWTSLGIKHGHIFAHDYGTSIATELTYRLNQGQGAVVIQSITLCNGSMLIDMANLLPIQRLLRSKLLGPIIARLSNYWIFSRNLKRIWYDSNKLTEEEIKSHWNLIQHNNGRSVISKISRYTIERKINYDRWIGSLEKTTVPIYILWADKDPIAVIEMAYKLNDICKISNLKIIENCGHYPMIESPEIWLRAFYENPYLEESQ